jgi:hypothetical protein
MKLYVLTFNGTQVGESGEVSYTNYSMERACKTCGTGAELDGNLPVKKINTTRLFFDTLDSDYIISNELYNSLKLKDINIDKILNIIDYKTRQELPYRHLKSAYTFPKMRKDSTGIKTSNQCQTCFRSGYYDKANIGTADPRVPRVYKYSYEDIEDLLPLSDFFNTWECFGVSNLVAEGNKVIRYARPSILVRENIKEVFEYSKVKNAVFEEVMIMP